MLKTVVQKKISEYFTHLDLREWLFFATNKEKKTNENAKCKILLNTNLIIEKKFFNYI